MTAYRLYELPEGRTAESFHYRVDAIRSDGRSVDDIVTDDRDSAFRIIGATLEQGYSARFITDRETRLFGELET